MVRKNKSLQYYEAVGRRKRAVAQVRLYICAKDKEVTIGTTKIKAGEIFVNGLHIDKTFPAESHKQIYLMPLNLTDSKDRFAISTKLKGGGKIGQLDALVYGLAKALVKVEGQNFKPILRSNGLLTIDARERQRRMVGRGGKARKQKQSPKR